YHSIKMDGYTQPIVAIWNGEKSRYEIVDGFHRYFTAKSNPDILARNLGRVPLVVIDKPINDRMASTVRHNRARGKHSVSGMASMVFQMLDQGWDDAAICNELGMEAEELVRLKHVTGFSKLFADVAYKRAWMTRRQIEAKRDAAAA
ncbi:MAG: ParB N-terminal domain-containing protein, partial [Hyphomicrobiaceae bacterium]